MSRSVRKQKTVEKTKEPDEIEEEEEENEEVFYDEIEKLETMGIMASDIAKLKSAGIYTIAGVKMNTRKDLSNIKGLSDVKVEKILAAACKIDTGSSFMTAYEVREKRKEVIKITVGSKELDKLLGGGIESQSITEVFGEFRTGKTQLSHTLCVTAQLPQSVGGGNGKVAFIDTEGTFRPENIVAIAERFGVDPEETLNNIMVARAFTHEQQMSLILEAAAKMVEEPFRLLIVDSATALFRADFCGRGELSERQQKLGKMLSRLSKLGSEFNIAILITNQVVSDPGAASMFVADAKKPIGGHILAHASTTRLYFRKGKGEQRVCKIYDSPNLPESEAVFSITTGGINDSTE